MPPGRVLGGTVSGESDGWVCVTGEAVVGVIVGGSVEDMLRMVLGWKGHARYSKYYTELASDQVRSTIKFRNRLREGLPAEDYYVLLIINYFAVASLSCNPPPPPTTNSSSLSSISYSKSYSFFLFFYTLKNGKAMILSLNKPTNQFPKTLRVLFVRFIFITFAPADKRPYSRT